MKSEQMVCSRAGDRTEDWTWRNGGRDEDLELACLLLLSEWPVGSQGGPRRFGGWDKAMSRGKETWRNRSV